MVKIQPILNYIKTCSFIIITTLFTMDFKGQKLAYILCYLIIIGFAVIGGISGIVLDSFFLTFEIIVVGFIVASIVCIPDWPMYNRNPVQWAKLEKTD